MAIFRKKQPAPSPQGQPVYLSQKDAQRLANTVHFYETGRRPRNPSTLPRAPGGAGGVVTARFTGAWQKGTLKTITFLADTAATAVATNMFSNVAQPQGMYRKCAIAQEGTTWILIAAEC